MANFTTWKFTWNFTKFSIKCMITTHNLSIISTTSLLAAIYFSIQEWWFNTDSLGSTDYIVFTLRSHKVELSYIHPNLKQKHTKQKLKTHKGERITWKLRRLKIFRYARFFYLLLQVQTSPTLNLGSSSIQLQIYKN